MRSVRAGASRLAVLLVALSALPLATCQSMTDLCTPQQSSFSFFSKGDCVYTRSSFFQGHEWITYLANEDLPVGARFDPSAAHAIAEGNRRVDWPKELLVHLNSSVYAYLDALLEYTDRPEVQPLHFLLNDQNSTREAAQLSLDKLWELTGKAVRDWGNSRPRALNFIGRATHMIQDSFSASHTLRSPEPGAIPWSELDEDGRYALMACVKRVKGYAPRAPGFERYEDGTPILFHGGDDEEVDDRGLGGDQIGHTSTEDSIYTAGRECREPSGRAEVERCLRIEAQRARLATRDYLALVRRVASASGTGVDLDALIDSELEVFVSRHLGLCDP